MPRPYWSGQLRLSLVSCPIYLTPATSESERIRLNQINPATGNRIALQPVDVVTRDPVERSDLVRGYEIEKGHYVILTNDELDDLKIESSRVLDLTAFVDRASIDPLYIDASYYVYPEKGAEEAYRVIAEAMLNKRKAALGRVTFAMREHPVLVEPFGGGILMATLRSTDEVRAAEFDFKDGKLNPEMIEIAETIIERMKGKFEPTAFRDRYQDALRELIEAKAKGMKLKQPEPAHPSNVIDLMAALKRSLQQNQATSQPGTKKKRGRATSDRRQGSLLLPVRGGGRTAAAKERQTTRRRRAR